MSDLFIQLGDGFGSLTQDTSTICYSSQEETVTGTCVQYSPAGVMDGGLISGCTQCTGILNPVGWDDFKTIAGSCVRYCNRT